MLSRESLLFSPTREGVPSSDDNFTAEDLVAAQDALEAEARETLPFAFSECTYDLGYIKQPLYACLTCLNNCAVCAACSISCHGEHQLVELFNRRHFRCDCGTERMGAGSGCNVSKRNDAPRNSENRYDKNFTGVFCTCGVPYDPHTETDSMYQCLICEDWLHHACLLGAHIDSEHSPLGQDDFDQVVCDQCVRTDRDGLRTKLFERYAGVEGSGVMLLDWTNKEVIGRAKLEDDEDDEEHEGDLTEAKPKSEDDSSEVSAVKKEESQTKAVDAKDGEGVKSEIEEGEHRPAKRARIDEEIPSVAASSSSSALGASTSSNATSVSTSASSAQKTCKAPAPFGPGEISPLRRLEQNGSKLHVFLEEGWMLRWCRCAECLPLFDDFSFFLEEEDTYEPPDDPDAHKSTHELGMDALSRMPREQAIEGAIAFQGLSERLKSFLRPYSESGATVTKELIDQFFAQEREALAEQRR